MPVKLKNYLGVLLNICLNCLNAPIQQLHKEQQKYYGLDPWMFEQIPPKFPNDDLCLNILNKKLS